MILLLDIGNSRIKWATADDGRLGSVDAREHGGDPAALLQSLELPPVDGAWVAHVLGAGAEPGLSEAVKAHCGAAPRLARTQTEWEGLQIAYADASRLGVDRWLGMVALWAEQPGAFCVANAGTALTLDAVDDGGLHLGGLIAPGLVVAQKAILGATRFGAWSNAPVYGTGLGQDTDSCVSQGALHAAAGLVERGSRLAGGDRRVITGGDAPTLLPQLGSGWAWRPNLVLEGLLALARQEQNA